MSDSSRSRKSRRRQLQASHQKNWLVGRHAVLETMRAARWPVADLFVASDLSAEESTQVRRLAKQAAIAVQVVSAERITELCHATHHQGYAARMGPFPFANMQDLLSSPAGSSAVVPGRMPLVVVCDRIQDTFNFGAILRCCDGLGITAVVIGETQQAAVTPQVARSSAGAVNHIPIVRTEDLSDAVRQLDRAGFVIAAASEKSASPAWDIDLRQPVALIIGSEAVGVSETLLESCRHHLKIPMLGKVESLNAAVAAGILLYEIRRQQK
ncbi:MAG: 23S rRNA (guanosine(2251)-2'-O)-methyltransferase RlmB [Fuerstiella sp.]